MKLQSESYKMRWINGRKKLRIIGFECQEKLYPGYTEAL